MVPNEQPPSWTEAIERFIQERLKAKLDKLKADDEAERIAFRSHHQRTVWVTDAARRVTQIQAVTHSLKPIHPDARGTSLYVEPTAMPALAELGSHALGPNFSPDVVGNAAALDVYKFLKIVVGGQTLLAALTAEEPAAVAALHDDPEEARALRDAFVSLAAARTSAPSSHTRAKQVYWLAGDDACSDNDYELLAPLFATSLTHAVHAQIQEDRFGDANKAARQARREGKAHDGVLRDYPDLAVQKLGGTKPQNISQLNSERGGVNYLLSSLPPPPWKSSAVRLPAGATSVFAAVFPGRPGVRATTATLRKFLESDPAPNEKTRERREALVDTLIDELVAFAGEMQQMLAAGWTLDDPRFTELARAEQLWLDPLRGEIAAEKDFAQDWLRMDWPREIGRRFANWLNHELAGKLGLGDAEARQWAKELLTDEGGFKQQLRELREELEAPNYIPIRPQPPRQTNAPEATA